MRLQQVIGTCIWALATGSLALELPSDHYLWGPEGSGHHHHPGHREVARAAKAKTTSSSSHKVTSSSTKHTTSSTKTTLSTSTKPTTSSTTSKSTSSTSSSSKSTSSSTSSTRVADSVCTNGANTRSCWSSGYSIATDFDAKWPTTGKTVSYNLEITNTTCNPDGAQSRPCLLINGQYPGPTIQANWGDTLSITVKNSLTGNGTGLHWHGIRQYHTNTMDGVDGITECPLAPGDTKTYTFQATQFGTSWYHSHYSSQYGDGVVGAIVINGPASANYDIDLGSYTINDWFYKTAFQINAIADQNLQSASGPPPADTILINGTNKNSNGGGSYSQVKLTAGKKYRLRLINTSVDNNIRVSLDNHPFSVITSDFVPIHPFTTDWVLLAIGQRYDVVFTANQTSGNYWFRAEVATDCASSNNYYGRAIFSYSDATVADPSSTAATLPSTCADMSPLVPYVSNTVPSSDFASQVGSLDVDLNVEQVTTNNQSIVVWGVNLTAIDVTWDKPTLEYVKTGNTSYPSVFNLINIPNEGVWSYWIIQETAGTPVPIPHPIHLHGHDFYVLGTDTGTFDINSSPAGLTFSNPPRRDVTFLPAGGWVALAFQTDNPGAWLMHCHIAWHISEGLGVQFLEAPGSINLPDSAWETTCSNWKTYWENPVYPKTDSGLRKRTD